MAIEGGALMASVVAKSRLRTIALNPANTAGNEVDGTASGGVDMVVAAEGKKVQRTHLTRFVVEDWCCWCC